MTMKRLMSAAHAAGYAMAGEDLAEPPVETVALVRSSTALVVRMPRSASSNLLKAHRFLRRLWLRDWVAGYWHGRAAA
jgi:hypothetical protein